MKSLGPKCMRRTLNYTNSNLSVTLMGNPFNLALLRCVSNLNNLKQCVEALILHDVVAFTPCGHLQTFACESLGLK